MLQTEQVSCIRQKSLTKVYRTRACERNLRIFLVDPAGGDLCPLSKFLSFIFFFVFYLDSICLSPRNQRWPDAPHPPRNRSHLLPPSRSIFSFLDH